MNRQDTTTQRIHNDDLVPTLRVGMPSATLRVVFRPRQSTAHSVHGPHRSRAAVPAVTPTDNRLRSAAAPPPKTTRSVADGIPTRSVGTRLRDALSYDD